MAEGTLTNPKARFGTFAGAFVPSGATGMIEAQPPLD
jgi:hypothetical protein